MQANKMKKILTILILLIPFLGIAQGSTFPYATVPVTQQKIIKGSDKIWTFTKTGGKIYYVDKNGSVEIPDVAGFIAASRTLTLTAGTGISITGGTQDLSANRTWTIGVSSLGNASIASGANIDASKLGTGIISTTEFNYLDGVTSNIQTQLDGKSSTSHNHTLDALSNVTITSKATDDLLKWNGTAWVNFAPAYLPINNPSATGTFKIVSGLNNVEFDQTQLLFRRTTGSTMNIGSYRAYSHDFYTASTYAGLVQAMTINKDAQVNIGNKQLDGITDPNILLQVGSTSTASARIQSDADANLYINGATGGTIASTTGNLNYSSTGNHIFNSKVTLPDSTTIGAISSQELSYLNNVTSNIQTQFSNIPNTVRTTTLTGYTSGAGTVTATDNVLQAIQKLNGNIGLKQNALTNPVTGNGTSGYLLKYTGATSVENSGLIESSGKFGIGTANPITLLHLGSQAQQHLLTIQSTNTTPTLAGTIKLGQNNRTGLNYRGELQFILQSHNGTSYFDNEVMTLKHDGKIGIGTAAPIDLFSVGSSSQFQVSAAGVATASQYKISALNTAPASATATGTLGEIRITSTYIYICTATNTWVRASLSTW